MPDANENYFVSTYLTYFNYRHLISKIKINKLLMCGGFSSMGPL